MKTLKKQTKVEMNKAEKAFKNSDMYKHGDFEDFYSLDHVTRDNIFEFTQLYADEQSREKRNSPLSLQEIAKYIRNGNMFSYDCDELLKQLAEDNIDWAYWEYAINEKVNL